MANHKSAEKRARQSLKKRARNNQRKAAVKTYEKNLLKAIDTKSKDLETVLKSYMAQAMKAVSKGILKKESVARKIARLSKRASSTLK